MHVQEYLEEIMAFGFRSSTKGALFKGSKILVSKETVVLRRWEIETDIYFIKRVDKGGITFRAL